MTFDAKSVFFKAVAGLIHFLEAFNMLESTKDMIDDSTKSFDKQTSTKKTSALLRMEYYNP